MPREQINIVWLKRDLRTTDHEPFLLAEKSELRYVVIFLLEPSLISHPDTSLRHLQFQYHSVLHMREIRKPEELKVNLYYGDAVDVFKHISNKYTVKSVFSHRESGTNVTFNRDKSVAKFFQEKKIVWKQSKKDAILRGIENREGWDRQWYATMHTSTLVNSFKIGKTLLDHHSFLLPDEFENKLKKYPSVFQPAGENYAWTYLKSFVADRGKNYQKHISKPLLSRKSCGRISPYLAWGNLSIKQAYLFVRAQPSYEKHKRAYGAFLTRLKWHCHFIQKFEVECRYETHCVNSGYELLKRPLNEGFVQAWKEGKTGFPLLDACMRCVKATGWINFRMRAMVVSMLTHHFDQDWRTGVYYLANQFLDYEPGIHYPQFQMQAGTTGVNTVRMYNPVKQSQDHDPDGVFIKKWIPELAQVEVKHIHEPWKMTPLEQAFCGVIIGEDYPEPLVDLTESGKKAREKIWGHRNHPAVRQEKYRILELHTRNDKQKRKEAGEDSELSNHNKV